MPRRFASCITREKHRITETGHSFLPIRLNSGMGPANAFVRHAHSTSQADANISHAATSATIDALAMPVPDVMEIDLRLHSDTFSFRPGQWVDFFIPGMEAIGGYSITSTPSQLPTLSLAIKVSRHPPAQWVHSQARVGMQVHVRSGGNFHWESHAQPPPLLFVAGGIGVTPLYSMMQCVTQAVAEQCTPPTAPTAIVQLLYSVSSPGSALFLP
jgi:ferredoxin-NADP reductase